MIIYLDESKKIWEWKIVIWWFITEHNNKYINKFVEKKKIEYRFNSYYWNLNIKKRDLVRNYFIRYDRMSNIFHNSYSKLPLTFII